jgi:hypothetical protein
VEALASEFEDALKRIQVDAQPAQKTQEEVRSVLEGDNQLQKLGVDTILIGSYSRNTGVHPAKDVDIFAKLPQLDTSTPPNEVFELVRNALTKHYGSRAKPQARSVKIDFPDEFCADVVPAVRFGSQWAIPAAKPELWANAEKRWIRTDPEKLGQLTVARNSTPTVGSRGAYVPVVKLMRQTRRHHLKKAKPGGLYVEILTYWAFEGMATPGSTYAEIFAFTLRSAAEQLGRGVVTDPALDSVYSPAPSPIELATASAKFAELASKSEEALRVDRCQAAVNWRYILGDNPDGPCFRLPDGCDEFGRVVPAVTAVVGRGSNEARPFA